MSRRAAKPRLPASTGSSVSHAIDPHTRWQELFGCAPPRKTALVELAIAWKEQEIARGDVPAPILRDLRIIADQLADAREPGGSPGPIPGALPAPRTRRKNNVPRATQPTSEPLLPAASQLSVGTRLVKHHDGETHVVEVTADGMLYRGQLFASLSAIAKAITGTHWNGLLFFGLRRRRTYPRKVDG